MQNSFGAASRRTFRNSSRILRLKTRSDKFGLAGSVNPFAQCWIFWNLFPATATLQPASLFAPARPAREPVTPCVTDCLVVRFAGETMRQVRRRVHRQQGCHDCGRAAAAESSVRNVTAALLTSFFLTSIATTSRNGSRIPHSGSGIRG